MSKEENKKKYNSDITAEDRQALNKKGRSMNKGLDKELDHREKSVDFTADHLDIPGSHQTVKADKEKLVDEENYRFNKKGVPKERENLENLSDPDTKRND